MKDVPVEIGRNRVESYFVASLEIIMLIGNEYMSHFISRLLGGLLERSEFFFLRIRSKTDFDPIVGLSKIGLPKKRSSQSIILVRVRIFWGDCAEMTNSSCFLKRFQCGMNVMCSSSKSCTE